MDGTRMGQGSANTIGDQRYRVTRFPLLRDERVAAVFKILSGDSEPLR